MVDDQATSKMIRKVVAYSTSPWEHALTVLRLSAPISQAGIEFVQGNQLEQVFLEPIASADCVVIQRDFPRWQQICQDVIKTARAHSVPLVYEIDDLIFELPEDHPDRRSGAYSNVSLPMLDVVRAADAVTTTTPELRDYLLSFNPRVVVLPNYLLDNYWEFQQPVEQRGAQAVRVGYIGSNTHKPDLEMVAPALNAVLQTYQQKIQLHFIGAEPPDTLRGLEGVSWTPFSTPNYAEYARFLSGLNLDIVIAPLVDNLFNRCKSSIKFLEYSTLGAAGIYSKLAPFERLVEQGKMGFLASTRIDWQEALTQLIENPSLRHEISKNAQQAVQDNWMLSGHAHEWREFYTGLARQAPFFQGAGVEPALVSNPSDPEKTITASVIILTYNNLEYTRMCLESVIAKTTLPGCTHPPGFEIILIDNASQDQTPEYLRQLASQYPNLRFILNQDNQGFAKGNNQGAALAKGEYLVFLNNDTVVTPGWLEGLIQHLQDPQIGMVGPVTNSSGNESQIAVDYLDVGEMPRFADDYTKHHAGDAFEVQMMPFQCVALRRPVYNQIGPLDERFGQGMFEDDDYALRLHRQGYRILCAEDVFIHHWGSASFSKLELGAYWSLFRENLRKFEEKWEQKWLPSIQRAEFVRGQFRQVLDGSIFFTSVIRDQAQQAESLRSQLANVQAQHSSLQAQNAELEGKVADKAAEAYWLRVELNNIYQSNGWRFLQRLLGIRRRIIPEGSRREGVFRQAIKLLRDFNLHQVKGLFRESRALFRRQQKTPVSSSPALASSLDDNIGWLQQVFPWPLVSVILPVYNHADMLESAARSVLNSTYPNLELVILDDGSTDDIEPVLDRLSSSPRVKVYRQANQKLPRALTHAHAFARGELITWTSSDNFYASEAIMALVDALLDHPEAVMVYADVALIDDQGNPLNDGSYRPQNLDPVRQDIARLYRDDRSLGFEADNYINACFLYRKQAAHALEGYYADDLRGLEDYDFWLRIQKAGPILHIQNQEPLYYYRVHRRSMSHELLSQERSQHIWRGERLIEFEAQRRKFANRRWTISIDPSLPIQEQMLLSQALEKLPVELSLQAENACAPDRSAMVVKQMHFVPDEGQTSEAISASEAISVLVSPDTWKLTWRSARSARVEELPVWKGISPNPLALKARQYNKNTWEFPQAGTRTIIGSHFSFGNTPVDLQAARQILSANPRIFFVFMDTPDSINEAKGRQLVEGLENAVYLGARNLWESYQTYACFDLLWLPPLTAPLPEQKKIIILTLACLLARPVLLPVGQNYIPFPYQYCYDPQFNELINLQELLRNPPDYRVLDRYLASWSAAGRLGQLLRFADAVMQDIAVARPDFDMELPPSSQPVLWKSENAPGSPTLRCALLVDVLDRGGLEGVVAELALHLPEVGVDPFVVCTVSGGQTAERLKAQGVRVYIADGDPVKVRELLERENPGVVHSHFADLQYLAAARQLGIPVLETIHNTYTWFTKGGWQKEKQRSQYFNHAVAVSQFVRQYYLKHNPAINPQRVSTIPNGIQMNNLKLVDYQLARRELGLPASAFLFIYLASYDGRKNQLGTLTAFDTFALKHPEAVLFCAGHSADPEYFKLVSEYRESLATREQIHLHGFRQDTAWILSAADAFILNSFFEGWSLAATEALAAGLPLIHSECGSGAELVGESGERGFLIPNPGGDPLQLDWELISLAIRQKQQFNTQALEEAMSQMVQEREIWSARRTEIVAYARREFNAEQMLSNYAGLLVKVGHKKAG